MAGEAYRTIRNTIRFLIANLSDYDPEADHELSLIDRWVMQSTDQLTETVKKHLLEYDFNQAMSAVHNFCVNELSRFYLDAIKDSIYCDGANWPSRRGAQRACHYVVNRLVRLIAPVLVHTADEAYERIPHIDHRESAHCDVFLAPEVEFDAKVDQDVKALLDVRGKAFAQWEQWKAANGVKDSQDVELSLSTESNLTDLKVNLPILFKMADVKLISGSFQADFQHSTYESVTGAAFAAPMSKPSDGKARPSISPPVIAAH
ncbi:MAG: class I tRNA ligase family protein [Fimbriimonadaceae bacterium]